MLVKGVGLPAHPAYTSPTNPAAKVREHAKLLRDPTLKLGDSNKGVEKLYQLTTLENPPLRLVLGKNAFAPIREQLHIVEKDMNEYESWSEDLLEA